MHYFSEYESPIGVLTIASDGEAICGLWLEGQKYHGLSDKGASIPKNMSRDDAAGGMAELRRWMDDYFARPAPETKSVARPAPKTKSAPVTSSIPVTKSVFESASASSRPTGDRDPAFLQSPRDSDPSFSQSPGDPDPAFPQVLYDTDPNGIIVFEGVPLRPIGSDFRKAVWRRLLDIQYGSLTTYGQISESVKRELGKSSSLAVGGAVGHNPVSIIIPCHRVVGSDGSLTGYAGGLDKKTWLLSHEGVSVSAGKVRP